jgi:DNA repair exonuclease SbcCD nuclease subunit
MKRTNQPIKERKPTAILTADWHLREDQPICRIDNFWEIQWKKLEFIFQLHAEYRCTVLFTGDLFNHWKPSPLLLTRAIKYIPCLLDGLSFRAIYGNHDLPQWNLDLAYKSGVDTLAMAGVVDILSEAHWNTKPHKGTLEYSDNVNYKRKILLWHVMTFPTGKPPWPGCEDMTVEEILDKYPQFDLIVTGHNHKTFIVEKDGRLLVNPGSLTRQTADQVDHHPCVFLWYAEDNTVEKVIIPHQDDVISRVHIDRVSERDERIQRFISQLSAEYKVGLTFEENLERFEKKNNITSPVMEIIRRAIE